MDIFSRPEIGMTSESRAKKDPLISGGLSLKGKPDAAFSGQVFS